MTRLRWRLARWIAPAPILAAPIGFEGQQVFVLVRVGDQMHAWYRAKTFRMKLGNNFEPAFGDDLALINYLPGTHGRFVGTL